MNKSVQYFKVVDTRKGHYGFFYKLGINTDPNPVPLNQIRFCGKGALYFTTLEYLSIWAENGDSIAWITPVSTVMKDDDYQNIKWKAHSVNVTRILPFKKALPLLLKELTVSDYENFGLNITEKMVMESSSDLVEKLQWFLDEGKSPMKFLVEHQKNAKVISHLVNQDYDWTISEVKALLKAGLHRVIGYEAVCTLVRNDEYKILKNLVDVDHVKFIKLIAEF